MGFFRRMSIANISRAPDGNNVPRLNNVAAAPSLPLGVVVNRQDF